MTYFTYHSIPHVVNLFPVLPIGHQVEVVGELHSPGQLLQDVDAEPLAALLHIHPFVGRVTAKTTQDHRELLLKGCALGYVYICIFG